MQCITAGELDRAFECLADDVEWKIIATSRPVIMNKGQLRGAVNAMLAVFTDGRFRMSAEAMIAEDDRVAVEAESYGKLKGGKIYNNKYHVLCVMRNGRIKEAREYNDTAHVMDVMIPALASLKPA
jgi:ketosteroid isomerase-like protein